MGYSVQSKGCKMTGQQLQIFKPGGHYLFLTSRERTFVAYNIDAYKLTDDEISESDIVPMFYKQDIDVLKKLRSETWSSNCNWFFVLQDEGIYLFNIWDNNFFLCKKHTMKFIKMFVDAPIQFKVKSVKNGKSYFFNQLKFL